LLYALIVPVVASLAAVNPFSVDGQPVVVLGDAVEPHAPPVHKAPIKMVQASGWMSLNGVPVCHAGHLASCGHASTGRGWFNIPG
jgi:uncharacterized Zn-binding protein involved in type VI secretion